MSRRVAVVAAWVALAGCSGVSKVGEQPSWRHQQSAPEPEIETIVLEPITAQALVYNDPEAGVPPSSPAFDAIEAAVESTATEAGISAPTPDARLYAACADLAAAVIVDEPLPYRLITTALHWHGIIEPSPHVIVAVGEAGDTEAILAKLGPALPDLLASGRIVRMGIGESVREDGRAVTVVAFQESFVDTQPVSRKLPAGGTLHLQGIVKAPYSEPKVFVTGASGEVTELSLVRFDGRGFRAQLSCGQKLGRHQIEIAAEDAAGSAVLANFPVWCGTEPPDRAVVKLDPSTAQPPATEAEAAAELMALMNGARKAHGLEPLAVDEELAAVARAHSDDMHATGIVAHISPTTGSAADRVRAAGIRTGVVLENVARAYSIEEGHRGLMSSPGHRANILSDEVSHAAVGITFGAATTLGQREVFITQLFIRRSEVIDVARARIRAQDRIRKVRALARDDILAAAAQAFAQSVAGGVSLEDAAATASARVQSSGTHFSSVTTLATTVADLEQFDPAPTINGAPAITHYGVGIAQGTHDIIGENAIFIVVLFAVK